MRHVDDGTIHAWLDHQVTEPQEVAWITTHLRECATCSARLAEEEATVRDAEALLSSVAPYADASREAFEALVVARQKSGAGTGAPADHAGPGGGLAFSRWLVPAGLAATIALAIGLGWTVRYMTSSQTGENRAATSSTGQQMARVDEAGDRSGALGAGGDAPDGRGPGAAPSEPAAPTVEQLRRSSRTQGARADATVAAGATAASTASANGTDAAPADVQAGNSNPSEQPLLVAPSVTVAVSAPPAQTPVTNARQQQAFSQGEPTFRSGVDTAAAQQASSLVPLPPSTATTPPPAPAPPPPVTPLISEPPVRVADATVAQPDPTSAPPAAAAPVGGQGFGAARGGGRGGAGGGRSGGGAAGGARAGGAPAGTGSGLATGSGLGAGAGVGVGAVVGAGVGPTPDVPSAANQGPVMVDGLAITGTPERAEGIDWTVLSRDLVVTRSGMALYGIDGLTPARTMVNADGSRVRTVYVVNAAEVVLLQEKRPASANTVNQGQAAAPPSETTAERTRPTLGALQQRNAPSVWSSQRGEVVLTLRGSDAAGLGARVRPD